MRAHGGPDARGAARWDFSTNASACGPCPQAHAALQGADATRYPEPSYTDLRARLARLHHVEAERIVVAGSGSEFIFRFTAWAAQQVRRVSVPPHAFGDYADAANAYGLEVFRRAGRNVDVAALTWLCEPSSPLGQADLAEPSGLTVVDLAYEPLRLAGACRRDLDRLWQLWTPNKALGLTGVRGAYAIAPLHGDAAVAQVEALAPSWVLGAHGAAMLQAWCEDGVQEWVKRSRKTLIGWKARQLQVLGSMGWTCWPSDANFFTCRAGADEAQPGLRSESAMTAHLREAGIQLRDCSSFGLPGHFRLSVQAPDAQDALLAAWQDFIA